MFRNIFKEAKERKNQEHLMDCRRRGQFEELVKHKLSNVLEDERYYDTTYVIYSSEFPDLGSEVEKFVRTICDIGVLTYDKRLYPDGPVFYIYVKKREEPKYEVGDVYHQEGIDTTNLFLIHTKPSDLMILGRAYDGKGRYIYATIDAYEPNYIGSNTIHWRYLI